MHFVLIEGVPGSGKTTLAEKDGSVLRIVYKKTVPLKKIVSVYFDRTQKGKW